MDSTFLMKLIEIIDAGYPADALNQRDLALVPSGFKIEDVRPYDKTPRFFRQDFRTHLIESFGCYVRDAVKARGRESLMYTCYVQLWSGATSNLLAQIIFDHGTVQDPGHGHHKAQLALTRTPLFDALVQKEGERIDKRSLIEFLEDWGPDLSGTRNGDEIPIQRVLNALRNFKVESKGKQEFKDHDLKASRSSFAELDASNNDMPSHIVATGVAYFGLPSVDMPMRLSVNLPIGEAAEPTFKLTMTRRDVFCAEMERHFTEALQEEFEGVEGGNMRLIIGRLT